MNFLLFCLSYIIGSTETEGTQPCSLSIINPKDNVCFVKCKDNEGGILPLKSNIITIEYTENKETSSFIEENDSGATSIVFENLPSSCTIKEFKGDHQIYYSTKKHLEEIRIDFFYDKSTKINFLNGDRNSHFELFIHNQKGSLVFRYENEERPFFVTNMDAVYLYCDCNSGTNLLSLRNDKTSALVLIKPVTYVDFESWEPFDQFRYDPIRIDKALIIYYVTDNSTRIFFHYNDDRKSIY
jgi:hypothetical protein